MENQEINKSPSLKNPEIALDSLEARSKNTLPCIANQDGSFSLHYNNQVFDFRFNEEKMCFEVAQQTQKAINYATQYLPKKSSFEYNQSFLNEDGITQKTRTPFPVNLIYASTFEKILGENPDNFLEKYAQFLTEVNQKKHDKYDNSLNTSLANQLTEAKDNYLSQLTKHINNAESFLTELQKISSLPKENRKAQELAMIQYIATYGFKVTYGFKISDLLCLTDNFSDITLTDDRMKNGDKIRFIQNGESTYDIFINNTNRGSFQLRSNTDKLVLNTLQNFSESNTMIAKQ